MIYAISIYKDKKDVLLLLPTAKTEAGFSIEINKPIIIEKPYTNIAVGEKVKECLDISRKEPVQPIHHINEVVKVFEIVTGIKSYSKFSKERLSMEVFMDTEKGYTIMPLVRHSDGSYRPSKERYPEIKMDLSATSEQIGKAITDTFQALQK